MMQIAPATIADIPALVKVINSAYRATEGVKGWTYEGHLLEGTRTDAAHVGSLIAAPDSVILVCRDEDAVTGSVHLEKQGTTMYLGMLSVDPTLQNKGTGRAILNASRKYALEQGCTEIKITVISIRYELIAWYERCGFVMTEEKVPFHEGEKFGKQQQPLELCVMKWKLLE